MESRSLPSDVVIEILQRLRVKPLLRFCCVSKSWSALISDSSFRRSHHQRSKQNPLLFLTTQHEYTHCTHYSLDLKRERSLEYLFNSVDSEDPLWPRLTVLTCTDLVCMYDTYDIYVVNPATRQQITLSKNSSAYVGEDYIGEDCFDQNVAFGYVASTSEYKVFRVIWFAKFYYACEVFTLGGSNSWRPVESLDVIDITDDITTVEGSVYIMSKSIYESCYCIFRFDLEKEEWAELLLPEADELFPGEVVSLFSLKEATGVLCLACFAPDKRLVIWLLKDHCKDGEHYSWVKEYNIDISTLRHANGVYPLAIKEDGRVVLWLGYFLYYDPKSKSFESKSFEEINEKRAISCSFYVESFMSLSM